ncbi:MAG: helix-turn-helix transcriptional regulator [Firmicutes bacterium]|nr:helix-turn-helix transcriptional regulator [Bacillota bacterium]
MDSGKIGAYIQLKRKSAGLTQTQLGDMLGITSKAVSKWETGVAIPDVSLFPELTKILNITMEELLQGEDNIVIPPEKKKRNIIIALSIILSLVTVLLITTIIYFKSNYKKVEVYKLESANKDFYVEGSLTNVGDKSYLSITKVDYLGNDIDLFEEVSGLEHKIEYDGNIVYASNVTKGDELVHLKHYFNYIVTLNYNINKKMNFDVQKLLHLKLNYYSKEKEINKIDLQFKIVDE